MRIGRVVAFPKILPQAFGGATQFLLGQVIGFRSGDKTVGDVPDDTTGDGLHVLTDTIDGKLWVARGEAHKIRDLKVAAMVWKALGVKLDKAPSHVAIGEETSFAQVEDTDFDFDHCAVCKHPLDELFQCTNLTCVECPDHVSDDEEDEEEDTEPV